MVKIQKYLIIVQARFKSSRFEGKILKKFNKYSLLEILLKRLKESKKFIKVVVACTHDTRDDEIVKICKKNKVSFLKGHSINLIQRYKDVVKKFPTKNIIRITSDCPFADRSLIDEMIRYYEKNKLDYLSNNKPATFPDGLDVEIFKANVLEKLSRYSKNHLDREHVTSHINRLRDIKLGNFVYKKDISKIRVTLDEPKDLKVISKIFYKMKNKIFTFKLKDLENLFNKDKKIFSINSDIQRDEGFKMNQGQKFWKRANNIIPGGSMLFSKNPDLFLPKKWPAYFSKTRGCNIWDLDKKKYFDISFMGVGTNILGYSNRFVDKAVKKIIKNGNISTLNSTEEIILAEKLIDINKWAKFVRFARTGGEASSIALRIARAATNRDKVAVCGYHGWHDWYLAGNLENKNNLNNHLMKNLLIKGVPSNYQKNIKVFEYNDFLNLKKIMNNNNLGAVIMEVSRDKKPTKDFLKKVRKLTEYKKVPLIFDECTSGFRETFGGLHIKYGVNPDIIIYGKALGNGYAINAVVGREDIMKEASKTFISSTFWTERIGSGAAIETLNQMEKMKSWKIISENGKKIKKEWEKIAERNKQDIEISGLDAIPKFVFKNNNLLFKTFISSEFLKKKFLAGNTVYVCTEHKKNIINKYLEILEEIFHKISKMDEKMIYNELDNNICISGVRDLRL